MAMTVDEVKEMYLETGRKEELFIDFLDFLKVWLEAPEERRTAIEQFIYACNDGCSTEEAISRVDNEAIREEMTNVMLAQA